MYKDRVAVIIPARLQSTRLPGKVLYPLAGKAMVEWVYQSAVKSRADAVFVATHDDEVIQHCKRNYICVINTSDKPINGTERIAEALEKAPALDDFGYIVNVQGDEPLIDPEHINLLIDKIKQTDYLTSTSLYHMATLYSVIRNSGDMESPNVVKVVMDNAQRALYFSRKSISFYKHHGVYAYARASLETIIKRPVSQNESRENLEQLRALDNGYSIACVEIDEGLHGVDCYADVPKVEAILKQRLKESS